MRLEKSILSAAEVTAHEFFHLWNVKRFYPEVFSELDYDRAQRTNDLWFCEGVTSYYEAITLMRSGLWGKERFYDEMAYQIERLQETEARTRLSVAEASWTAWEHGYRYPNVSYYNKGQLIGLLLDIEMRALTENRVGLDDLMRYLNVEYGHRDRGWGTDDLENAVTLLTEKDFSDFFKKYIFGTDEMPFESTLGYAGLDLEYHAFDVQSIGDVFFTGPENRVISVEKFSPAAMAGLKRNDYIRTVDGIEVTSVSHFDELIQRPEPDEQISLTVFRRSEDKTVDMRIALTVKQDVECAVYESLAPDSLQNIVRLGLLHGIAESSRN